MSSSHHTLSLHILVRETKRERDACANDFINTKWLGGFTMVTLTYYPASSRNLPALQEFSYLRIFTNLLEERHTFLIRLIFVCLRLSLRHLNDLVAKRCIHIYMYVLHAGSVLSNLITCWDACFISDAVKHYLVHSS